jgi:hypothetical protein
MASIRRGGAGGVEAAAKPQEDDDALIGDASVAAVEAAVAGSVEDARRHLARVHERRCGVRRVLTDFRDELLQRLADTRGDVQRLRLDPVLTALLDALGQSMTQLFEGLLQDKLPPIDPTDSDGRGALLYRVSQLRDEVRIHRLRIGRHRRQFAALAAAYRRLRERQTHAKARFGLFAQERRVSTAGPAASTAGGGSGLMALGGLAAAMATVFGSDDDDDDTHTGRGGNSSPPSLAMLADIDGGLLELQDDVKGLPLFEADEVDGIVADAVAKTQRAHEAAVAALRQELGQWKATEAQRSDNARREALKTYEDELRLAKAVQHHYEEHIDTLRRTLDACEDVAADRLRAARAVKDRQATALQARLELASMGQSELLDKFTDLRLTAADCEADLQEHKRTYIAATTQWRQEQRQLKLQIAELVAKLESIESPEVVAARAVAPYMIQITHLGEAVRRLESEATAADDVLRGLKADTQQLRETRDAAMESSRAWERKAAAAAADRGERFRVAAEAAATELAAKQAEAEARATEAENAAAEAERLRWQLRDSEAALRGIQEAYDRAMLLAREGRASGCERAIQTDPSAARNGKECGEGPCWGLDGSQPPDDTRFARSLQPPPPHVHQASSPLVRPATGVSAGEFVTASSSFDGGRQRSGSGVAVVTVGGQLSGFGGGVASTGFAASGGVTPMSLPMPFAAAANTSTTGRSGWLPDPLAPDASLIGSPRGHGGFGNSSVEATPNIDTPLSPRQQQQQLQSQLQQQQRRSVHFAGAAVPATGDGPDGTPPRHDYSFAPDGRWTITVTPRGQQQPPTLHDMAAYAASMSHDGAPPLHPSPRGDATGTASSSSLNATPRGLHLARALTSADRQRRQGTATPRHQQGGGGGAFLASRSVGTQAAGPDATAPGPSYAGQSRIARTTSTQTEAGDGTIITLHTPFDGASSVGGGGSYHHHGPPQHAAVAVLESGAGKGINGKRYRPAPPLAVGSSARRVRPGSASLKDSAAAGTASITRVHRAPLRELSLLPESLIAARTAERSAAAAASTERNGRRRSAVPSAGSEAVDDPR